MIESKRNETTGVLSSFPRLVSYKPFVGHEGESFVVLITKTEEDSPQTGTGMVVQVDSGSIYAIGTYRKDWWLPYFEDYKGKLTLENK